MREITYREALNEALREEMLRDEKVFLFGEDIGIYGGANGVTKGLMDEFGAKRVLDTPISEAAITGAAAGAALVGTRPVAEIMFVDFLALAMDQLVNQAAKMRYMFGGKARVPMVIRTQGGAHRSWAAQHGQSLEAWFMHVPGLYVVMPSSPADAKGLLKAAIRDDNPVLFIEHKAIYLSKGQVPEGEHIIPLGQAVVKRPGRDVTIVTYSRQTLYSLEAADKLAGEGIEAEVIDLRCLNPLDMDTVVKSVQKTNRVVVVAEDVKTAGVSAEISARITETAFDFLDAPVVRCAGKDVPLPCVGHLERAAIPSVDGIAQTVRDLCQGRI